MCIAVLKPAGKDLTDKVITQCFERNPDGAGFAWFDGENPVQIRKGFFTVAEFIAAYRATVKPEDTAILHFRIKTSGAKNEANCHPFFITHGVLAHNGPCINHRFCPGVGEMSDSMQFAEQFVKDHTLEDVQRNLPFITSFVGSEKVIFLFNDGQYIIVNEALGTWDDGVWYSNYSFRDYSYKGGYAGMDDDGWLGASSRPYKSYKSYKKYGDPLDNLKPQKLRKLRFVHSDRFKMMLPTLVTSTDSLCEGRLEWWEKTQSYVTQSYQWTKSKGELVTMDGVLADDKDIVGFYFDKTEDIVSFITNKTLEGSSAVVTALTVVKPEERTVA